MKHNHWILLGTGAVFAAILLKSILVAVGSLPFNSDEAVVGLMAKHISQGARPVFFYGQVYMGSLDAYLIAIGFQMFGDHIWVIRLVQILLYIFILLSTGWVGKEIFGDIRVGILAMCLLAIPTVNMTLYTTVTLGGYAEMLLIGNLILMSGFRIANQKSRVLDAELWNCFVFGFLSGLGLWVFGLTLV